VSTRARNVAWCEQCSTWAGVWISSFNQSGRAVYPKRSRHMDGNGKWCPASGQSLSPNVVMAREAS
jgi:hypothetical protein